MDEGKIPVIKTADSAKKFEPTNLEHIISWFDGMRVLDGFDNLASAYRSFGFQSDAQSLIKFRNDVEEKLTQDKSYVTKDGVEQVDENNKKRVLNEIDEFIKRMSLENKGK